MKEVNYVNLYWASVSIPGGPEVLCLDSGDWDCSPQRRTELRLQDVGAGEDDVLDLGLTDDVQDWEEPDPVALARVLPGDVLDEPWVSVPAIDKS